MRIYVSQLNPTVGDVWGNAEKLKKTVRENSGADLILFPELFLTGYPPQDLLFNKDFLRRVEEVLLHLKLFSQDYPQTAFAVGLPRHENGRLFNSVLILRGGLILGGGDKSRLSSFRLFDEHKYFTPGAGAVLIRCGDHLLGLALGLELDLTLAQGLKNSGAGLIINPAAIPFRAGQTHRLKAECCAIAEKTGLPIFRAAQVGGSDELIFAGGSLALDQAGAPLGSVPNFVEGGVCVNAFVSADSERENLLDEAGEIYRALVLGLRDYVHKSGLKKVIIGISGGLDSAVAAVLACEALGSENVWAVTQPGPYSLPHGIEDARKLAKNLRLRLDEQPITQLYEKMLTFLGGQFSQSGMSVAKENIQARLRGNLLMALSNQFGGLVLTNSNKSELAVGYTTLYGDMSGGLAVLGDVYKTQVYQLAHFINRRREIIPRHTIEKPPSAELRPDQRDDESLPPYDLLDGILRDYLDQGLATSELIARGYPRETVHWVVDAVERNEYKRRQAALILRITTPIWGPQRQMPVAAVKNLGEVK